MIRLILSLILLAGAAVAEERLALVIGNGEYASGPLRNPPNDANLTSAALRDAGFDVTTITNADQNKMKQHIRAFNIRLKKAGPEAVAVFYFAGHGVQVDGRNYLIPTDATLEAAPDLEYETVEAQWVLDMIGDSGAGLSVIILDACRNNPFRSFTRSGAKGLARMDAPRGVLLSYSTAPGDVAMDGEGANSPFTAALAEAIRTPGLKIEEAFKQVRRQVLASTGERQLPWESTSLTGDFYFTQGNAPAPQPAALTPTAPAASAPNTTPAATTGFVPPETPFDQDDKFNQIRCYDKGNDAVFSGGPRPRNSCPTYAYPISDADFHKFIKLKGG
ncbi:MAG: caspase family protein [Pseudomonadota bacterium]